LSLDSLRPRAKQPLAYSWRIKQALLVIEAQEPLYRHTIRGGLTHPAHTHTHTRTRSVRPNTIFYFLANAAYILTGVERINSLKTRRSQSVLLPATTCDVGESPRSGAYSGSGFTFLPKTGWIR
jgi:hypothetical protein